MNNRETGVGRKGWGAVGILLATVGMLSAADLVLVQEGQPRACILIPREELAYARGHTAVDLQQYIKAHTGAELPIVRDGAPVTAEAVISLGMTDRARKAGIDVSGLPGDCGIIRRAGDTLFIVGRDIEKPQTFKDPSAASPIVRRLMGTKRTMVHFLHEVLGYRFFYPGLAGTYYPPTRTIAVGNLDLTTPAPRMRYGQGGGLSGTGYIPYRINLGGMNQELVEYHGGHSFYAWVPERDFFKDHPDWFRMEKGIRTAKSNHICPSSEELKRHIVGCMEKIADNGFMLMEHNYADGWLGCDCPACLARMKELGLPQTAEGAEELMKRFTRDTCDALLRSRPEARVMVLAYGPLRLPPRTFERYPDNVVLQLAYSDPQAALAWKGIAREFTAYTYQWSYANPRALAGLRNLFDMADDARAFLTNGYQMIYFCGSPHLIPIESPAAYVTGRILNDPSLDADVLLQELCEKLFGPAADAMQAFYTLAHRRIQVGDRIAIKSGVSFDPYMAFQIQWPAAELDLLQLYLDRARTLIREDRARLLLDWIQDGFDYLDRTARLVHIYIGYRADPDPDKLDDVEAAVRTRQATIDRILANGPRYKELAPVIKASLSRTAIEMGGEGTTTQMASPLTWDFATFRKEGFLPGKTRLAVTVRKTGSAPVIDGKADDPAWRAAEPAAIRFVSGGEPAVPTAVRVAYDEQHLYLLFVASEPLIDRLEKQAYGRDGSIFGNECCELFLDPRALGLRSYHFILAPQEGALLDERIENGGAQRDKTWNPRITWAYTRDLEAKEWRVEVAIPFAELGVTAPEPGAFWLANFTRTTRPYPFGLPAEAMPERFLRKHNTWSPIFGQTQYADPKGMGRLVFAE